MKKGFLFLLFLLFFLNTPGKKFFLLAQEKDKFYLQYTKSYETFSRDKYLHSPVREKKCSSCHRSEKKPKELTAKGNDLCYSCHKRLQKEVKEKKVHSLLKDGECTTCHQVHSADNPALLSDTGKDCLTCHDPGGTKKAHFGILVKRGTCLSCHQSHISSKGKLLLEAGHPMFLEGSCDVCHTATGPDGKSRLSASGEKLCYTCHGDIEDLGKKKTVHAVLADCTICHSAHVARIKKLLPKKMNDLCYDCHLQENFKEHPVPKHPVFIEQTDPKKKNLNCISCHHPHASDNKSMLSDSAKDCISCHDVSAKEIKSAHFDILVAKDSCGKCHTRAKTASVHPDFAKPKCTVCHKEKPKEGKVELLKPGKELCFTCHSGVQVDLGKKYPHGIVKDGECTTCHEVHRSGYRSLLNDTGENCSTCHDPGDLKGAHFGIVAKKESCSKCHRPHGSEKAKLLLEKGHPLIYDKSCDPCHQSNPPGGKVLLTAEGEKLCFMCHSDIEDLLKKKFVHKVAQECGSCHLSHLSEVRKLLLKEGENLCRECHPTIEPHPIPRHPISGVIDPRFLKEKRMITCISCHNPHGSDEEKMLLAPASRVCLTCHQK